MFFYTPYEWVQWRMLLWGCHYYFLGWYASNAMFLPKQKVRMEAVFSAKNKSRSVCAALHVQACLPEISTSTFEQFYSQVWKASQSQQYPRWFKRVSRKVCHWYSDSLASFTLTTLCLVFSCVSLLVGRFRSPSISISGPLNKDLDTWPMAKLWQIFLLLRQSRMAAKT